MRSKGLWRWFLHDACCDFSGGRCAWTLRLSECGTENVHKCVNVCDCEWVSAHGSMSISLYLPLSPSLSLLLLVFIIIVSSFSLPSSSSPPSPPPPPPHHHHHDSSVHVRAISGWFKVALRVIRVFIRGPFQGGLRVHWYIGAHATSLLRIRGRD